VSIINKTLWFHLDVCQKPYMNQLVVEKKINSNIAQNEKQRHLTATKFDKLVSKIQGISGIIMRTEFKMQPTIHLQS
jgi:pentose-5-phosphate-3-epimerase